MGNLKDATAKSLGLDPEKLIASFGPMIDNMIMAVPLEKFVEIKTKNPEAKIVPIMTEEQIQYDETRLFLGLVNMGIKDLPGKFASMDKGISKVAFGLAYKLENDENDRRKLMEYVNKVSDFANEFKKEMELKLEVK